MGVTYVPYNPAADPNYYIAQGLDQLFSGLGQGLARRESNRVMGQDIQRAQAYQKQLEQYQRQQALYANQGPMPQGQTMNFLGTDYPVGNGFVGPRVPVPGAPPEQPVFRSPQARSMQLQGLVSSMLPSRPQTPLERANTMKALAETMQIGRPKVLSTEEQKNLIADTQLKMAQALKAAEEAGVSNDQKNKMLSNTLRGDYDSLSKNYRTIRDSYNRLLASAEDPSGAGDIALIFNYMKILDPGSVVRESEFATAENAANIPDTVRNLWNKALSGERVSYNRQDFINTAKRLFYAQKKTQSQLEQGYTNLARRYGLNPEDIVLGASTGDVSQSGQKSPYPEYPDAYQEGGKWYVKRNGQTYRIEE